VLLVNIFPFPTTFRLEFFFDKGITMVGGPVHIQKYWQDLLEILKEGKFDPTFIVSHTLPLEKAEDAYRIFDKKEEFCVKVLFKMESK